MNQLDMLEDGDPEQSVEDMLAESEADETEDNPFAGGDFDPDSLGGDDDADGPSFAGMGDELGDDEPPVVDGRDPGQLNQHRRAIFDLPVDVVISVGKARPKVRELLQMRRDSLIPLDAKLDDPVELMIGKRVIARGLLQEVDDAPGKLGVRLTEIVDMSEPF